MRNRVKPGTITETATQRANLSPRKAPAEPTAEDFAALAAALGREPGKTERERFRQDYARVRSSGSTRDLDPRPRLPVRGPLP